MPDRDPDGLARLIDRWAADARADDAAAQRSQERWLRQAAAEDTDLHSLLVGAAEHGTPVRLTTVSGHEVAGDARGAGADFVLVGMEGRGEGLVALDAVRTVRSAGGGLPEAPPADATGDVVEDTDGAAAPLLVDVLALVGAGERRVRLLLAGAEVVEGDLVAVGPDVATVRTEGPAERVHVALAALEGVWLPA